MFKNLKIRDWMTEAPRTIGEEISLNKAIETMREFKIRHLPVQNRAKVVGILSDSDIKLALAIHPSAMSLAVGDVMTEAPYKVSAETPIEQVAREMSLHKYGCAIVVNESDRAIGVFTMVDATRLLSEVLHQTLE